MYEKIQETASWLKERMTTNPETAIILGTGLGQLATEITDCYEFAYNYVHLHWINQLLTKSYTKQYEEVL